MKNYFKNLTSMLLIWGIYMLMSFINPVKAQIIGKFPGAILGDVISVILLVIAYAIVTKLIFKKPLKLGKAILIAVLGKAILYIYQSVVMRGMGMDVTAYNIMNILYAPFCASLMMDRPKAGREEEQTTLYRKKPIIQKGSQAEKFMNYVYIYFWAIGIVCMMGGFVVRPRSQAPGFFMIGIVFLVLAIAWTKRKINNKKIETFEKIVTPAHWPKDCQYEDYNRGLNQKAVFLGRSKELAFYQSCLAEQVTDLDSARNQQKAKLVAEKMGRKELSAEAIRSAYETGKQEQIRNDLAGKGFAREQELAKIRIQELEVLAGAMKYYGIHGREKRIAMLKDMYADAKEKMKDARFMQEYAQRSMLQKEHDWAIHGGIADGIAGPAAGIVTAMQVEAKNAAIREYNAQMAPYVAMVSQTYSKNAQGFQSQMDRYSADMERTKLKLLAEDPTEEVYKHLRIENMSYAISETGAVAVEADFWVDRDYRIFEEVKPAIDGVVAARLMENGEHVGSAYFVFPVDGVHKKIRLASICTKTTKPKAEYTMEYAPVDLWAIEKLD